MRMELQGKEYPPYRLKPDRTLAGDMYAAGVLYGIARQATPAQAARLGSLAASYVVQQMGARLPGNLHATVRDVLG